jgi:hypothetical protein
MKTIFEILQEAKDDNLHEFIQYIIDHGKEGELRAPKVDIGETLYRVKNIMDHRDFHDIFLSKVSLYQTIFKVKRSDIDIDDFVSWAENWAREEILKYLKLNNHNCIYVERAIVIPHFANKDRLYKWYKYDYAGHLGECWSYKEDAAFPYDAEDKPGEIIILKGYVKPESVDWDETVARCLLYTNEYELYIDYGEVQLTEIVTKNGNHRIFTGNLLMKI